MFNEPSLILELVAEHCRQKKIQFRAEPNSRKLLAYIPLNESNGKFMPFVIKFAKDAETSSSVYQLTFEIGK